MTLAQPSDKIIVTHDGALSSFGSVMYLVRNGDIKLGGFFSGKLQPHHSK